VGCIQSFWHAAPPNQALQPRLCLRGFAPPAESRLSLGVCARHGAVLVRWKSCQRYCVSLDFPARSLPICAK